MPALKRNRHEPFLLRWKKECGKSDVAHSDKYTIERFIHARPYIRQKKKVPYSAKRFSIASITVSRARIRAKRLQLPSIIVQGA
jgi:hypothetical protein